MELTGEGGLGNNYCNMVISISPLAACRPASNALLPNAFTFEQQDIAIVHSLIELVNSQILCSFEAI